jgi:hypothetical protein
MMVAFCPPKQFVNRRLKALISCVLREYDASYSANVTAGLNFIFRQAFLTIINKAARANGKKGLQTAERIL